MKVRSLTELQDQLDRDLSWRKKEFTTLKFMVCRARTHEKKVLLRSSFALLYAHWEGHVKHCATIYLSYLNHLAPKYCQMTDNFMQMSLGEKFNNGFSIKRFTSQKEIFEYISGEQKQSFYVNEKMVVNTESNLKYEVFFNIIQQLGLDSNVFELKENFIDYKLLKFRNAIVHGDLVDFSELCDAYRELEKGLLDMIQEFRDMVLTAAEYKMYLKEGSRP